MKLLLVTLFFAALGCAFIYACLGVIAANPNVFQWNIYLRVPLVVACAIWVYVCFKSGSDIADEINCKKTDD
jgi:hypothetical protein